MTEFEFKTFLHYSKTLPVIREGLFILWLMKIKSCLSALIMAEAVTRMAHEIVEKSGAPVNWC